MTKKIVHLCVKEKFIPPFIELVHEHFPPEEHLFLVSGKSKAYELPAAANVLHLKTVADRLKHLGALYSAEKIILHGLYDAKFLYLLALQPWLLKKCYWAIWGADLYQYLEKKIRLKTKFKELVRTFVIRRMGYLVGFVEADCNLARQWYGCRGSTIECLMYESNTFQEAATNTPPLSGTHLNIQVGNSAYPGSNHIEALQRISRFRNADISVHVPLSYGPKHVAEAVCKEGLPLLGEKFIPILDFMPLTEYQQHLAKMDIAVFNNTRQQAMGNIVTLLGMGKTVYLRRTTTVWGFFENLGITLMDAENFSLTLLSPDCREKNIKIIRSYFSKNNLINQLNNLFAHPLAAKPRIQAAQSKETQQTESAR